MPSSTIFWPALAMVALTAAVTFRMFFERVRQVKAERISFREIPSGSQMASRFSDTRAADNYRNLFEAPVLFYLALTFAYANGAASALFIGLAWVYVALRFVHTFIHCGYNRIRDRLYVFLASNLVLWAIWLLLAARMLRQ